MLSQDGHVLREVEVPLSPHLRQISLLVPGTQRPVRTLDGACVHAGFQLTGTRAGGAPVDAQREHAAGGRPPPPPPPCTAPPSMQFPTSWAEWRVSSQSTRSATRPRPGVSSISA